MPHAPAPVARPPWRQRLWEGLGPDPEPAPLTRSQRTWRLVLAGLVSLATLMLIWLVPAQLSTARLVLLGADVLVLPASLWAVQRRRQRPLLVAVVLTLLTAVFASASGPALLAVFSLAARRHIRGLLLVLPIVVGASLVFSRLVWPDSTPPHIIGELVTTTMAVGLVLAIGYGVGSRRAVKAGARERVEAAAREEEARLDRARTLERTRIAREMHDVLAHRISLVAMHAAALTYRPDLSEEERRTAAQTIERNARDALTELREVLGVLRDPDQPTGPRGAPERPQPTLRDLATLIAETRTLGTAVEVSDDSGEPPERVGRAAYRIVQESLTNARKHAPGEPVRVTLSSDRTSGLRVEVSHPLPAGSHTPPPGAGMGLLGLRERVTLLGGSLDAGREHDAWVVRARLPLGS